MITSIEYRERIAKLRRNLFMGGEKVSRDDPRIAPGVNVVAATFDLVENPEVRPLLTATSHLTGQTINRFTHIHQNREDLLAKQKMTRLCCQQTGGCIQRCMGVDALNALSVITYDCDMANGTEYHKRFTRYLGNFQEQDLVGCCAQTDVKGDRSLRPHEQADPDLYLRVVERRPDGIVVRGAKAHNTIGPYADEIIVLPTRALTPEETDWAVAFAAPADAEGIRLICRAAPPRPRRPELAAPIARYGDVESLTVFDNVFIPWERVFLCGETGFGGRLALLFALYHRHSYTGCKPAVSDIILGASALVAEYNGVEKAHHVRDKLAELAATAELVYAAGLAAAVESTRAASGTQIPNVVYCNVGRRHAGMKIYHEHETLADLAGGLGATLPYNEEFLDPVTGPLVKKYIARKAGVPAEHVYRCYNLISDLVCSSLGAVNQFAGLHGGGSPIMETIAIMSQYDVESRKRLARYLAGIGE